MDDLLFLVDGHWARLESARGLRREWGNLDRLVVWLCEQGFSYFWVRNDIDAIGPANTGEKNPP